MVWIKTVLTSFIFSHLVVVAEFWSWWILVSFQYLKANQLIHYVLLSIIWLWKLKDGWNFVSLNCKLWLMYEGSCKTTVGGLPVEYEVLVHEIRTTADPKCAILATMLDQQDNVLIHLRHNQPICVTGFLSCIDIYWNPTMQLDSEWPHCNCSIAKANNRDWEQETSRNGRNNATWTNLTGTWKHVNIDARLQHLSWPFSRKMSLYKWSHLLADFLCLVWSLMILLP